MIPLYHDFTDETVLVFGGGSVGARKARRFAAEARVVVVSPDFTDAEFGDADLVTAMPAPEDVPDLIAEYDPVLVVAATDDDAVNDAVADAAAERGLLVNRADESGRGTRRFGNVVVPATVEDGSVSVAVSTGGGSPALAAHLRERIESEVDGAGAMADLTADLRTDLRDGTLTGDERRDALRAVVRSPAVWKALRSAEPNARDEAERVIRTGGSTE